VSQENMKVTAYMEQMESLFAELFKFSVPVKCKLLNQNEFFQIKLYFPNSHVAKKSFLNIFINYLKHVFLR
jgi:hypothetical protein